jgi:CII-binding regulator of phage lambda lysogenization HflD
MKTVQQLETESILALGEAHNNQRDVIYRMGEKITELEKQLAMANDRVRQLESQLYGGK